MDFRFSSPLMWVDIRVLALSLRALDPKSSFQWRAQYPGKDKTLTQPSLAYYVQIIKYHPPCTSQENDHDEF